MVAPMQEPVKVLSFEVENFKRVNLVRVECALDGLTILGGKNRQGKSTNLDAICAALGGERFSPSHPIKEGGKQRAVVTVELSNGVTAKRIYTPSGSRLEVAGGGGETSQELLNKFVSAFALDLSRFMNASDKEKARILLEIIGVDLQPYDEKEAKLYQERENVGRLERRAKGHADSLPFHEAAGTELHTAESLMQQLQAVVTHNAKNREIRENLGRAERDMQTAAEDAEEAVAKVAELQDKLRMAEKAANAAGKTLIEKRRAVDAAKDTVTALPADEDDAAIRAKLTEIEEVNALVRANLEREKALGEVDGYHAEYSALSAQIEAVRTERAALLDGADMPLDGLSVEAGVLTYNGQPWDCMSHAEQLIAATAIVRKLNPNMGFVLVDKLEAMDLDTLQEYDAWLKSEGLQTISTRVSTGGECSLIIEDGEVLPGSVRTIPRAVTAAAPAASKPAVNLDDPEF